MRTALVSDDAGSSAARRAWPTHPDVISAQMLAEVGRSASRGRPPPDATVAEARELAARSPLAGEPFLLLGALAVRNGDHHRAEQLLLQARMREPRSPAARYLLADLYLRTGRALPAMADMAVMNRLVPAASMQLAPALAAYARAPGALPQVRSILAAYPELSPGVLTQLAADGRNADLILALAPARSAPGVSTEWQRGLVNSLIEQGAYEQALATWKKLGGVTASGRGLFNPSFEDRKAPPPFNWELARGSGGVTEARAGVLDVLYFGRDDMAFATQVLLLRPGTYRLAMSVSTTSGQPRGIAWKVTCLGGGRSLLNLPLAGGPGRRPLSAQFTVPPGCPAQKLELRAEGQEFPERANFQISALHLTGANGG